MKWISRILKGLVLLVVCAFLHYNLPSHDVVKIINADVKRMDVGRIPFFWDQPDAGTNQNETRDVRFINAEWPNGKPRVYRNEDTNWGWPPYLKFDSADLNAQAQSLGKEDDVWVAVSHYGWRIKLFSAFPNAYNIKRVAGPDTFIIPWFNIVFLSLLAFLIFRIWRFFARLKQKHVDPIADKIGDAAESAQQEVAERKSAIGGFFKRWFGSSKK